MPIQPPDARTVFVVSGPAGCGKTTVASYLLHELAIPYIEGDDYHGAANKAKMSNGISLSDDDRWDWLITLRNAATVQLRKSRAVIVTCSSLRRRYRDVFRVLSYNYLSIEVRFIYLKVDEEQLKERVTARIGHYMKESMVHSQVECLEEPAEDEFDVIKVDVQRDQTAVCKDALAKVREELNRI